MEHILLLVSISVFLFQIFQSANANSNFDGFVSTDLSLSEYYEKSAKDLVSERLSGTKFCESILLPTDHTLRKSLQATLFSARNDTSYDKDHLDSCCRSLHKCDAYKNIELNDTNLRNILHCECVHSFRICLKKINTSLSSDLAFIHSINKTKCYAKDHPIIKCVKLEVYTGSSSEYLRFMSSTSNDTFFNRCTKYEFDESQPQRLQLFDVPFIDPGMSTIATSLIIKSESETEVNVDNQSPNKPNAAEIEKIKFRNRKVVFFALQQIVFTTEKLGCEILSKFEEEERSARELKNNVVNESLGFLKNVLKFYCENKESIDIDPGMICDGPVINILGGQIQNFNFN